MKKPAGNVAIFSRGAILSSMGLHDTTRSWNFSWLILTVLVISLFATFSWAANVLKIGSLLANPKSYQLQIVLVTGIVSDYPQVKHFKKWANNVDKCVQFFTVKDETGSIQAAYEVTCSGAMDLLRQRDTVTLEARFEQTAAGAGLLHVVSMLGKVAN
jgi:hypothetical protein